MDEVTRRNREHDRRALAAVGITQGPSPYPDMDWPPVTPPGSLTPEQARALKYRLWCTALGEWIDERTHICPRPPQGGER